MKKWVYLYLLALLALACQQQKPVANALKDAEVRTTTADSIKTGTVSTVSSVAADSLMPATRTLLQQYDLAPLWKGYAQQGRATQPMEGFYGPPHYRISFYFSKVERDPAQPNVFHVMGLDRYKKVITPFSGTITVHSLRPFSKEMFIDAEPADSVAPAYTAVARFVLKEDPSTKGAGNYSGQALLDFYIDGQQHLKLAVSHPMASEHNPTGGAGLIFKGYHISNQTGQRKSVAFSADYSVVVPQTLAKLGIGDRSEGVNPNLAKLGWNEAWENDEWWAKSPKPSLNL
ncbi:hypothetical protein [Hymenobacter sp. B1770]|uniref:hypothetical protein n=1 Tax=Hymenobacter sp. B1770 TaxID=1718788 RepID=UPI003CECE5EC